MSYVSLKVETKGQPSKFQLRRLPNNRSVKHDLKPSSIRKLTLMITL